MREGFEDMLPNPLPITSAARATTLSRIRMSNNVVAPSGFGDASAEYAAIPRGYQRSGTLERAGLLDLFEHRLTEYGAGVYRATGAEISEAIDYLLKQRGKQRIAVPDGLPSEWLPKGFDFCKAQHYDAQQLNETEGALTSCTVAIAETGSVVLQSAPGQGPRILGLVPDYHLCVVFADQVVGTVPEAFARLAATSTLPTTFFSGPSATADIEMTRIKGVHGPRFLDILLVG